MSGKGGKGKGKTRGGGPGGASSQRRSRSRNTTPASTSAFSEITHLSTEANLRVNYDEVLEKYVNNSSSDSSSIPTSTNLSSLRSELLTLDSNAKGRSRVCDKSLRDLSTKIEQKKIEEKERQEKMELEQEQQERKRKAAEDEEEREKKAERDKVKEDKDRKRKEKKSGDGKRPLAVGAHQATDQGPSDIKVEKRKKFKGESPSRTSTSPSKSRTADAEHQPAPAPPYTVLETLDDDPTIYEIPTSTEGWSYEKKAKAFSVTRFPTVDLTDLGPGDPPDEDFSKAKPSNQVAMNTFNTYIDPYFRPFSEEDLGFLRERGDRVTPYIMPTLGQHYSEVWAAEDGGGFASPAPVSNKNPNVPKGSSDALSDDVLEKEEISCGPLLSRIMAAMIPEEGSIDSAPEPETPTHDSAPSAPSATTMPESAQPGWKVPTGKSDYYTLDERLQKEMQYIGLLGTNSEPDWKAREDDDVSAKLRELQKQLREQSLINGARKARIAEHLKEQLAHQEYATILDDLDKQVEQAYSKRTRNMKATKKKKSAPNGVGVAQARIGIGEAARTLMERRKKWMSSIGPVFDENITRLPTESIFQSMEDLLEKEKEGAAEEE